MPSSWSTKPAGTCPRASSCRPISPSFCCRRSAQSSTRSRTSGSSCATTGSPTASSNPTTISSTIVVRHGTSSSTSLGASCPSDCANGPTGSDQWDLVLVVDQTVCRLASHQAAPLYRRKCSSDHRFIIFSSSLRLQRLEVTTENHTISAKQYGQFEFSRQN